MANERIGAVNAYTCEACGETHYSLNLSAGTTPYTAGCLEPDCKGACRSHMYRIPVPRRMPRGQNAIDINVQRYYFRPLMIPDDAPVDLRRHLIQGGLVSTTDGPPDAIALPWIYRGNDCQGLMQSWRQWVEENWGTEVAEEIR